MSDLEDQSASQDLAEASGFSGLQPVLAAALAWVIPGAGHLLLRRYGRAALFCVIVLACAGLGCSLEGRLDQVEDNDPLSLVATLASMGSGLVYFFLRYAIGYQGDIVTAGYEYGTTFLRTAGILNLLLVLDAFDIGRGRKS